MFSQGIAAGEMTGKVTVAFYDSADSNTPLEVYIVRDGSTETEVTRTVFDFAELAFANAETSDKAAALSEMCKAMLTFGEHAQAFYGISGDNGYELLSSKTFEEIDLSGDLDLSAYTASASGTDIGVRATSQLVNLDSVIYLRTYLTIPDGMELTKDNFALTKGGEACDATIAYGNDSENGYFVDITNIPPAYWKDTYTIRITKDGATYELNSSVYAWIKTCLANATDANEKQMAEAMYHYCEAAADYFTIKNGTAA